MGGQDEHECPIFFPCIYPQAGVLDGQRWIAACVWRCRGMEWAGVLPLLIWQVSPLLENQPLLGKLEGDTIEVAFWIPLKDNKMTIRTINRHSPDNRQIHFFQVNLYDVRFGSKADINASAEKYPLSGVKRTPITARSNVRF